MTNRGSATRMTEFTDQNPVVMTKEMSTPYMIVRSRVIAANENTTGTPIIIRITTAKIANAAIMVSSLHFCRRIAG
jgi:hypothetical protein